MNRGDGSVVESYVLVERIVALCAALSVIAVGGVYWRCSTAGSDRNQAVQGRWIAGEPSGELPVSLTRSVALESTAPEPKTRRGVLVDGYCGTVHDVEGRPVQYGRVDVLAPDEREEQHVSSTVWCDERGGFLLGPTVKAGTRLRIEGGEPGLTRPGIRPGDALDDLIVRIPEDQVQLDVVLPWKRNRIGGTVESPDGRPVHATVLCAGRRASSSPFDGWFSIHMANTDANGSALVIAAHGFSPAVIGGVGDLFEAEGRRIAPIRVRLELAKSMSGRVVDASGQPVGGLYVGLLDPIEFGGRYAEDAASHYGPRCWTNADGGFTLGGLQDRAYTVQAVQQRSLLKAETTVRAGSEGVVLRLPTDELRRVAIFVTRLDGTPVSRKQVSLRTKLPSAQPRRDAYGAGSKTNESGIALFEGISRRALELEVADYWPESMQLPAEVDEHAVVVLGFKRLRFHWTQEELPDDVVFLNRSGAQVPSSRRSGLHPQRLRWSRNFGRDGHFSRQSDSLTALETAADAVLYRQGAELIRLPIDWVSSDEVTVTY